MKTALIVFVVLFVLVVLGAGGLWYFDGVEIAKANTQSQSLNVQITQLTKELDQAKINNAQLTKQAYPETFSTPKEMTKWLEAHKPIVRNDYYSTDAMALLNSAREEGKWMGIIPVMFDLSNKNTPVTVPIESFGDSGYIFCVTMLKDGSVYLVDPALMSTIKLTTSSTELEWDAVSMKGIGVH